MISNFRIKRGEVRRVVRDATLDCMAMGQARAMAAKVISDTTCSAGSRNGKRTFWAMVIAGDYDPKRPKGKGRTPNPLLP